MRNFAKRLRLKRLSGLWDFFNLLFLGLNSFLIVLDNLRIVEKVARRSRDGLLFLLGPKVEHLGLLQGFVDVQQEVGTLEDGLLLAEALVDLAYRGAALGLAGVSGARARLLLLPVDQPDHTLILEFALLRIRKNILILLILIDLSLFLTGPHLVGADCWIDAHFFVVRPAGALNEVHWLLVVLPLVISDQLSVNLMQRLIINLI